MQKLKNERGVILMATIIFLTLFLLITGIIADYMRIFIVKRELQDSLDAAVISAAQSEKAQLRSNYEFNKGQYICRNINVNGVRTQSCGCENWQIYTLRDHESLANPGTLATGDCHEYVRETDRWIDYNKGTSASSIANTIYEYNNDNSTIIKKNIDNGNLTGTTASFTVYNNPSDTKYPSVSGQINASIKTTFLNKYVTAEVPIVCKAQATTHFTDENGNLNIIPADAF